MNATANNTMYCDRIDCGFFRELQENQVVASYDLFYQKNFKKKFDEFLNKSLKVFLKEPTDDGTTVMNSFSNYFKGK